MNRRRPHRHSRLPLRAAAALALLFAAAAHAEQGDLSISIDDGLTHATPGRPQVYTITTRNAGPDTASGLIITSSLLPPSCSWTCDNDGGSCQTAPELGATLPAGAVSRHVATCLLPADASGSRLADAQVIAPAGFDDTDPSNDCTQDSTQVVRHAALRITLTDFPSVLQPGNTFSYTINAANDGPQTVTGAHVLNLVPSQYTGCSWTCSGVAGGTCTSAGLGDIDDTAVGLPPNGQVIYTASCTVAPNGSGTAVNVARIVPPEGYVNVFPVAGTDTASDSNLITANGLADTGVEIISPDEFRVSSATDYWAVNTQVAVSNRGSVPATVPVDVQHGYASSWDCPQTNCPFTTANSNRLQQTVTLPPHSRWELIARGAGYGVGTVYTSASVGAPPGDPFPGNNAATRLVYSRLSFVSIDSGLELLAAPQRARFGETVQYRFRASVTPTQSTYPKDTVEATIEVPAYLTDAVPSCATSNCRVLTSLPQIGGGSLYYRFRLTLDATTTEDITLTARVGTRPYADYWNEVLPVSATIRSSGFDFNGSNNRVDVNTALSLFRGSMESN
ncbi:MAG TPA: hypothetical protein VN153_02640 [Tahibacter sp.]|nr:hypothetical protein [Tahibacter sp.]